MISVGEIQEKIEYLLPIFKRFEAELIINDHLDLAVRYGIGVHLGMSDGDPVLARKKLGKEATIGITINDNIQRAEQYKDIVDYVGVGPVFPTKTKLDAKSPIGIERLKEVVIRSPLPVVAIGGIQHNNAHQLIVPNPKYIAVCSAICSSKKPLDAFLRLRRIIR